AYPVTYYGDTTDAASASPVNLAQGGAATVQINLRAVPAAHLDLGGAMSQTAPQGPHSSPNLAVETLGGNIIPVSLTIVGVNGRQELGGVAPGRYVLRTMTVEGQRSSVGPAARVDITGNTSITPEDLKTTSLSGEVSYEGAGRPASQALLQLSCANRTFVMRVLKDGGLDSAGNFLEAGHCEVALTNVPGFYVKSVTTRGGKPSADTVDIVEGADNRIAVVVAKGAISRLQGLVVQDDKALPAAMVLLLPEDLTRATLIRRDQSDSDGTFTLPNILPGRYTLLAIDDGKGLPYRDPTTIQPYLAQGAALEFPRPNDAPVKVNVIARRAK
ncbi:MAG: hypothetical protein ACRD3J_26450, partial [Thermoanaerobaculia bacterium]